jgi:hypothetical protein
MKFRRGDKVICIDANWSYGKTDAVDLHAFVMIKHFPELLKVYTVREAPIGRSSILLAELVNPILINANGKSMEEIHWNDWRFIKVKKEMLQQPRESSNVTVIQLDLFQEVTVVEESKVLETT